MLVGDDPLRAQRGFDSTYEGLKPGQRADPRLVAVGFDSTYEGLKPGEGWGDSTSPRGSTVTMRA